jgi:hypothetical protein
MPYHEVSYRIIMPHNLAATYKHLDEKEFVTVSCLILLCQLDRQQYQKSLY